MLSVGPSEILGPLYISNVERVYIGKWSQNLICIARSPISGIPKGLTNLSTKFKFRDQLSIYTFATFPLKSGLIIVQGPQFLSISSFWLVCRCNLHNER